MVQDRTIAFISYLELYLQCYKIEGAYCLRIWSIEQRHFQRPWTTINPDFKVTPLFDAEYLRNSTTYRYSFNGML